MSTCLKSQLTIFIYIYIWQVMALKNTSLMLGLCDYSFTLVEIWRDPPPHSDTNSHSCIRSLVGPTWMCQLSISKLKFQHSYVWTSRLYPNILVEYSKRKFLISLIMISFKIRILNIQCANLPLMFFNSKINIHFQH